LPEKYQPSSRRPIADAFRVTARGSVNICLKLGIHPDAVSYGSVVAAACAAVCFWQSSQHPWLLLVGPAFCYIRLWLNMLDGMVAIASGKASVRGEILNDLPDRVSDVMIFVGVAHSGLGCPFGGYWVAILALITAYVGMFGQAAGVRRQFGGLMSKPWRMVSLHFGAWLTYFLGGSHGKVPEFSSLTVMDWTEAVIIIGCVQTIFVRLRNIMMELKEKESAT
jgi:phosphatidylglycerophosphate synthase